MVTIYDIAKKTGFSAPTVSKALNDQSDIGAETKAVIVETAKKLGYIPNPNAKGLITKKSWLIGLIMEEDDLGIGMEHPLFAGIMNAFKTYVEAEGYELLFLARNLGRRKMSLLDHCRYRRVDAVLIVNCDANSKGVLEVVQSDFPCISSNIVFPQICTVTSESLKPSVEAVQYLYKLGHRLIAHIAGPIDPLASAAKERLEGYKAGLMSRSLPIKEDLVAVARLWNANAGYEAMISLWEKGARPTALYCAGDILAVGVMNACHDLGLNIPGDLSIISFDDNEWSANANPPLTTYKQDRLAIGRTAAALLLDLIDGKKVPNRTLIPVKLTERSSCRNI
ncbi:LacI family DNA-binding transcriptional regulator [Treponema sp.]